MREVNANTFFTIESKEEGFDRNESGGVVRFNNIFIYISLWVIQTQRVRTGPAVDAVRARTGNKRAGRVNGDLTRLLCPLVEMRCMARKHDRI